MSARVKKTRGGLVELYRTNLEQRIQLGGWNLVCRDEELFKEVESVLSEGAAQDTHCSLGLDPLSVMEASLQALPITSRQTGLEKLAKAFEVLELAALNLYLCPWRKEYRAVKMFSGMFTHYVKPALTSQQSKELFGLLGYQPAGSSEEEEELRLSSKPVKADTLLQLACAFFAARVECQLLLSHAPSLGACAEWELQLVLERKRGHSLQKSRESVKRKLESQILDTDMPADVDLYTDDHQEPGDQAKTNHTTALLNSKDTPLSHRTSRSQREKKPNENSGMPQTACVSTLSCQISSEPSFTQNTELGSKFLKPSSKVKQSTHTADTQKYVATRTEQQTCSCLNSHDLNAPECCECCQEQVHDLRQAQPLRADGPSTNTQDLEQPLKRQNMKTHSCMDKSTCDIFAVCYECEEIHDLTCNDIVSCRAQGHNIQSTGRLQWGAPASPRRHSCLRTEDPPYVVCDTCNQSHDCLCTVYMQCRTSAHIVKYLVEMKEEQHAPSPVGLHKCCDSVMPGFVCFTCNLFHTSYCRDEPCFKRHDVHKLETVCTMCSHPEIFTLCRFCCTQYCKECWYKHPITCRCGMPIGHSSPV